MKLCGKVAAQMWLVGLVILGLGVNGLFPAQYAWQMPLWLSLVMIVTGAVILVVSPGSNAQGSEPAQPQPQQCLDESSDTASSKLL